MNHENLKLPTFIRQLKIIYFTIMGAPVMMAVILTSLFSQPQQNTTDSETLIIFGILAVFFSMMTFVLSIIFPPKMLKFQLKPDLSVFQKLSIYRVYFIIKSSLIETSWMIHFVFFLITEHVVFIIAFFIFALLAFLTLKPPTEDKVIQTLCLSNEEVSQIS